MKKTIIVGKTTAKLLYGEKGCVCAACYSPFCGDGLPPVQMLCMSCQHKVLRKYLDRYEGVGEFETYVKAWSNESDDHRSGDNG